MKRIVRITESDLTRIVRRIITEQKVDSAKLISVLNTMTDKEIINLIYEYNKYAVDMGGYTNAGEYMISVHRKEGVDVTKQAPRWRKENVIKQINLKPNTFKLSTDGKLVLVNIDSANK